MLAQREAAASQLGIALHLMVTVVLEGFVGSRIQRVFDVHAKTLVLHEMGVGEQDGPLAVGIVALEHVDTVSGLSRASLARVEQEQVVPALVVLHIVGILGSQSRQCLLTEPEIVEFVLEDDARMEEAVLDQVVAGSPLLVREGYLRQVVFALMGVEGGTVGCCLLLYGGAVGCLSIRVYQGGVARRLRLAVGLLEADHRLVQALPVVLVLALAPQSLEGLLTLADRLRIIEIPQSGVGRGTGHRRRGDGCGVHGLLIAVAGLLLA